VVGLAQASDRSGPAPLDAVLLEHRDVADPEHDLGPAVAQLVERGRELSHVGRLPHVDRRDAGPESDPLGALSEGGKQQPRVLVVDLVGAVAGVVAEPICERGRFQELGRRLLGKHLEAEQHRGQPDTCGFEHGGAVLSTTGGKASNRLSSVESRTLWRTRSVTLLAG
jgi:hypothetical protein